MKKLIYLDYAAASPVDPIVLKAMEPYFSDSFYNPSAEYLPARAVRKDLEAARSSVACSLGAKTTEIIFTAGGTEANNLAIRGVMEKFPGTNMVLSAIEHDSVIGPSQLYKNKQAPVNQDGIVDIAKLINLIDNQTVLISVMCCNNEVGSIQPVNKISAAIDVIRKERLLKGNKLPIYLHSDAAQAGNYLDVHVARLGVDLLTINGGKIYGPKQSGALFVKTGVSLLPQILGGGQEYGIRSGTENVAADVGLAKALSLAQERRQSEFHRLRQLQTQFIGLLEEKIPSVIINGSVKYRLVNNIHITLPGKDNERVLMLLDEAGILAAAGSACSASNEEPSHVLMAMGVSDSFARSSIRFTMGRDTDLISLQKVIAVLCSLPI
jgi:cysteine desulfurase